MFKQEFDNATIMTSEDVFEKMFKQEYENDNILTSEDAFNFIKDYVKRKGTRENIQELLKEINKTYYIDHDETEYMLRIVLEKTFSPEIEEQLKKEGTILTAEKSLELYNAKIHRENGIFYSGLPELKRNIMSFIESCASNGENDIMYHCCYNRDHQYIPETVNWLESLGYKAKVVDSTIIAVGF